MHAARDLGQAQRTQRDEEDKLEQLRQFRHEYQQRFTAAAQGGIEVQRLLDYQRFISKLEKAVEQQTQRVAASRRDSVVKRAAWQQKHTRSQAIGMVIDTYRREEDAADRRIEQRASDEFGLRGVRKKT